MILPLVHATRRRENYRKQALIARRRHMQEFELKQNLEMVFFVVFLCLSVSMQTVNKSIWMKTRSSYWWEKIVMEEFTESDWMENFRMGRHTFMYVCNQLCPYVKRNSTKMREPISVEKRVAVTIWRLATNVEYCTIGHLFGISRASVCCIVQEVCKEIVHVLMPKYIKWPEGEEIQDIVDVLSINVGIHNVVVQ